MYPHNVKLIDGKPSKEHPLYTTWKGMRERCNNPKHRNYNIYGGRGIKVCSRWDSFSNFVQDMSPKPTGRTLDRTNGDMGYSPDNCKWATPKEQAANRKEYKRKARGAYKNSPTKHAGIYPMPNGKFRAVVFINGKNKHIGCFDTISLASEARLEALKA